MALNRRQFGQQVGVALGSALALPELGTWARASVPQHLPRTSNNAVQLDSNENPYGPSPAARAAITDSEAIACRYPDACEYQMMQRLSQFYGLPQSQIMLGCGSTEVLRCADMAFLSEGKSAIAAEPTFETVLSFARAMQANPV
ncbi:MAG: aminotransferase class I/II-fold pyridoxal phosphate-dependent enzyme, partial [Terriglobales bacterium]